MALGLVGKEKAIPLYSKDPEVRVMRGLPEQGGHGGAGVRGHKAGHTAIVWASLPTADLRGGITGAHYSPNQRQIQ